MLSLIRDPYLNNLLQLSKSIAYQIGLEVDNDCTDMWITDQNNKYSSEFSTQVNLVIPGCGVGDLTKFDIENYISQPSILQALEGEEVTEIKKDISTGIQIASLTLPISKDQNIIGVVEIKKELSDEVAYLTIISRQFLLVWSCLSFITLSIGYLLARTYSIPFNKINQNIKTFPQASDDLFIDRRDEIGELSRSLKLLEKKYKKVTDDLSDENRSLSSILDEMEDGVLITDNSGYVTFINPAVLRFFGLKKNPTLHHNLVETLRDYRLEQIRIRCKESSSPQRISLEIPARNIFLDCIVSPIRIGDSSSILFLFQDITNIRKLEIIRKDFVSNVSHELRTPLASLKAITETLQGDSIKNNADANRFLKLMDGEIDHLTHMVQELVYLSQIESGHLNLNKIIASPIEIVQRAVERMRLQANRANLSITHSSTSKISSILVDPNRIEQVLMNLIHNAIKYSKPGGNIHVNVEQKEYDICFSVKDNGIGIPPGDLERIFERFYKVDRSRSDQGAGLGLSIVRHIVNAHGGKVWVESIQTQGSTFYFSLPCPPPTSS